MISPGFGIGRMGKAVGWFGLLVAATISGLLIKVIGDPLVEVTNPTMKDAIEETQDVMNVRHWKKQFRKWLHQGDR
jgi:hypothetical protein